MTVRNGFPSPTLMAPADLGLCLQSTSSVHHRFSSSNNQPRPLHARRASLSTGRQMRLSLPLQRSYCSRSRALGNHSVPASNDVTPGPQSARPRRTGPRLSLPKTTLPGVAVLPGHFRPASRTFARRASFYGDKVVRLREASRESESQSLGQVVSLGLRVSPAVEQCGSEIAFLLTWRAPDGRRLVFSPSPCGTRQRAALPPS